MDEFGLFGLFRRERIKPVHLPVQPHFLKASFAALIG
jgi:hypothetical protein